MCEAIEPVVTNILCDPSWNFQIDEDTREVVISTGPNIGRIAIPPISLDDEKLIDTFIAEHSAKQVKIETTFQKLSRAFSAEEMVEDLKETCDKLRVENKQLRENAENDRNDFNKQLMISDELINELKRKCNKLDNEIMNLSCQLEISDTVSTSTKTAFDIFVDEKKKDPEFASSYEKASHDIQHTDFNIEFINLIEQLELDNKHLRNKLIDVISQRNCLDKYTNRLWLALEKYGRHQCHYVNNIINSKSGSRACTCGLDEELGSSEDENL